MYNSPLSLNACDVAGTMMAGGNFSISDMFYKCSVMVSITSNFRDMDIYLLDSTFLANVMSCRMSAVLNWNASLRSNILTSNTGLNISMPGLLAAYICNCYTVTTSFL